MSDLLEEAGRLLFDMEDFLGSPQRDAVITWAQRVRGAEKEWLVVMKIDDREVEGWGYSLGNSMGEAISNYEEMIASKVRDSQTKEHT